MTKASALRAEDYIEHILGAIERIQTYTRESDQQIFFGNTLVQDAVIRNLMIIGEAANKITAVDPTFAKRHPQLRLDLAYRMRNALVHGYDSVNLTLVWNTICDDAPILKKQIATILQALRSNGQQANDG